jgi:hypothetical protein
MFAQIIRIKDPWWKPGASHPMAGQRSGSARRGDLLVRGDDSCLLYARRTCFELITGGKGGGVRPFRRGVRHGRGPAHAASAAPRARSECCFSVRGLGRAWLVGPERRGGPRRHAASCALAVALSAGVRLDVAHVYFCCPCSAALNSRFLN